MSDIYAIAYPPQVAQTTPAPVLLLLHGFGSNEHDLMGLAPYLDGRFHIVSARATYDIGFGYAWYYLYGVPGYLQHDDASRARSLEMLKKFIRELPERVGVQADKIYLLGFSQGAVMSLNVALTAPDLVAGVIAISGYLDDQVEPLVVPETLEEKHFLVMHGTQDDLIPVKGGRAVRDYLQSTPASIAYHEYPVGHTIHPDALEVIREWLASQLEQANEQGA
jgi:phospholipase/carboxylesterase